MCALIVTGIAAAQQRSSRVLSVPEAIDALNVLTAKQQKQIDALTAASTAQQRQIDGLTKELQNVTADLQKLRTAGVRRSGPSFSAGGIVRSAWDSLPGETIIPYRMGTVGNAVECYAHKSRFDKIPANAFFDFREGRGGGGVSKSNFNIIPPNAMLKFYSLSSDPG